jgi:hypothetical protein
LLASNSVILDIKIIILGDIGKNNNKTGALEGGCSALSCE